MSLVEQISNLAQAVGEDIKALQDAQMAAGTQQVFVQPTAPTVADGVPYLWWQTGLGDGSGVTLWVEDGL